MVIQEDRNWGNHQPHWCTAPLRLVKSFRTLNHHYQKAAPCRVAFTSSGIPVVFTYHTSLTCLAIVYAFVFQLVFPASKMFDLVSSPGSYLTFPSETLERWLRHTSCVLCDGRSSVFRTPFWLTLILGPSFKDHRRLFPAGQLCVGLCWLPVAMRKEPSDWLEEGSFMGQSCGCKFESFLLSWFRLCAVFIRANPKVLEDPCYSIIPSSCLGILILHSFSVT